MDNKAILSEIAKHATILDFHIKRLNKRPEQLHDIDIELMGDKVKEIYTLVNNLLPENDGFEVSTELEETVEERKPNNEERETKETTHVPEPPPASPEPRTASPKSKAEEQTPKTEERATNSESPVPRPSSPESIHKPEPVTVETEADSEPPKTTADLFSGPTTIADKFQAREDNSIAATVHPQPARDLKMAIGINDKFLFINELFQGDPSVYNQAIENMNAAAGLDDALKSVETYRDEYKWADNSEAYHRLKKIVNSKYNG